MTDYFLKTPLLDVVRDHELIALKDSDTIKDALAILSKYRILAAPTLDSQGRAKKSLDMLDLMFFATTKFKTSKNLQETKVDEFLSKEITNLPDTSNRNAWHALNQRKSLRRSITMLSQPHVHRVWVEDNDGKVIGVISQSKALEILLDHKDAFPELMKSSIQTLFPEARQVVHVFYKDSLLSAFQRIRDTKVSCLAVVDENFVLKGNISASDLKFGEWNDPAAFLNDLQNPIEDFLNNKQSKIFAKGQHQFKPVVARPDEALQNVMQKARENKVHRVYVVDDQFKPLYALSLSDLIGQFTLYPIPGASVRRG